MKNNKKGFTLVELIVVIAIIGILAAVLYPTITGFIKNARVSQHEQEAGSINTVLAVESIFNEVSYFQPQELETLLVGMDYELESTVDGYAFFYHVEKNRVEFLPISEAQAHDSKLVYQGVESLFENGLAYIDQAENGIRKSIDGIRNLVSDVRVSSMQTNTTVVDEFKKINTAMKSKYDSIATELKKSISSPRFELFDPENKAIYFDETGTFGATTKVIEGVVFAPAIGTLRSPLVDLVFKEGVVIELPSSVEIVEASVFSNSTVHNSDKLLTLITSPDVKFTGYISSSINKVIKESAINYTNLKQGLDFDLGGLVQITNVKSDGSYHETTVTNSNQIGTVGVGEIHTLIPNIVLKSGSTVKFSDIISLDIRSKILGDLQIFTGAAVDKDLQGYKLQNVGAILDVDYTIGELRDDSVLAQGDVVGKRVVVSDPLQGYTIQNLSNLKVEVYVEDPEFKNAPIKLELFKVTNESNLTAGVKQAYLGDFYFEMKGVHKGLDFVNDIKIVEVRIYNSDQLVFVKK